MKNFIVKNYKYFLAGIIIGLVALALTLMGNPQNMGFCIACFLRDIAGSTGMHSAAIVQYFRPEIVGIVLGAFVISVIRKDFKPTGGSAPVTRFVLGVAVMVGALIFLGCPLRMVLRIGGGDMNAVIGLLGFIAGIGVGAIFLNKGFTLKRSYDLPLLEGAIAPASSAFLFILFLAAPFLFVFSESGPGSMHAPIWAALIGGLIVGIVGQRLRVCFVGGIRDSIMFRQFQMIYPFIMVIVTMIIGNLINSTFNFGFENQPVAHTDWLWNFLGLFIVGWGSTFLGGCPFRQLVLAGSGNSDSTVTVIGMVAGAAMAHNFGLASSTAGVTTNGMIAGGICIVVILIIGLLNRKKVA